MSEMSHSNLVGVEQNKMQTFVYPSHLCTEASRVDMGDVVSHERPLVEHNQQ